MRGRKILTALPKRVLLPKIGPQDVTLNIQNQGILPEKRTKELEEPLKLLQNDAFLESLNEIDTYQRTPIVVDDY